MNLNLETGTTLKDFLKDILKNRFPENLTKQKIDDSNPKKINFSCPICGDSEKNQNKKRGNLYLESNTYKCYNDGCMAFMGLDKFIAKYCHLYSLMPPDIFVRDQTQSNIVSRKKNSILGFLVNESLRGKLLDLDYFTYRFSLTKMDDFKEKSQTIEYIKGRYLNESINFSECCYHDTKKEKIYIFNKDDISGKILGLSVRHTDPNYMGPKYKMMNYTEINREICKVNMTRDELSEIDSLNNIFNVLNIDFKKTITICEGQFDSMFINNCLASTGVGKTQDTISMIRGESSKRILLDNDKAGRQESIKLLMSGYNVFLWSKLIDNLKRDFSNKTVEIKKITDINSLYQFMKSADPLYKLSEFNKTLDGYFSNSTFDIIYL
jgi:hypothetical protein